MDDGQVVLVRHARPLIDPDAPAGTWPLDPASGVAIRALADAMADLGVDGIVTSPESKAVATAEGLAAVLAMPVVPDDRVREQGNDAVPWMDDATFRDTVAAHFGSPDAVVLGTESSTAAADRFGEAVDAALARWRRPVIVTHGRAMTAWSARVTGLDAVGFWQGLAMPDAVVVDRQARRWWRIGEEGNG